MPRKAPIKKSSSPKMTSLASPTPSSPLSSPSPEPEQVKVKVEKKESPKKPIKKEDSKLSASALKKISLYEATLQQGTPFPQWDHPSPEEAQLVADRLASVHGMPNRPKVLVDKPGAAAGCGQTPDVLDALIRTILSQNTTSKNSTRAKLSMDEEYGRAEYRKVLEGGEEKLEDTIRCGGLAKQKSKSIIGVLKRLDERQRNEGKGDTEQLSLDWLHQLNDADAMKELISYDLVGIKTASCVLLFCLGRSSFAVDTHVHRLTQTLGWLPPTGSVHILDSTSDPKNPTITQKSKTTTPPSRDQTFYHLDAVLPDHLKYPLHSLLVRHGRGCVKCAANGVTTQDIVDTCPIQDLIVRSRSGKKKGGGGKAKKVKVENEEGKVVGEIKEDEEGHVEVDVKPEVEKEIGERNKVKEEEEEVGVEDEVKQMKRPSRASKRAAVKQEESSESDYSEEEEDEEEEFKPAPRSAKRPKVQRSSSSTLSDSMVKTKKTASTPTKKGKKGGMTHSVDRDEAEMSGRVWKDVGEGAMHGMDG